MAANQDVISKIKRFYLFYGPNNYRISARVSSLIATVLQPGADVFDLDRFDGKGCDINLLINSISTPPVMSPLRIILLSNAEKLTSSNQAALEKFLSKIPEYSVLVMTAVKPDARSAFFKNLLAKKKVNSFAFDDYEPNEMLGLVIDFAKKRNKSISPEITSSVVDIFGNDLFRLENEIDKLSLFVGDKETIEKKDLAFGYGFSKVETIDDLPELLLNNKPKAALELTRRAIAGGISEIQILFMIRGLLMALNAAKMTSDVRTLMSTARVSPNVAFMAQRKARIVGEQYVQQGLMLVFRAEYALKSARFPAEAIIDQLIVSMFSLPTGNINSV